jgi:hypothetical protein
MHTAEMAETLEVAKTFIESLGGGGLHDKFVPGPDTVEIGTSHGHPVIRLDYHLSFLTDPDRAVVIESLAGLEQFRWGTATNPFGVAQIHTDNLTVQVTVDIYVPGPESRGPLLKAALLQAGWRSVAGVG